MAEHNDELGAGEAGSELEAADNVGVDEVAGDAGGEDIADALRVALPWLLDHVEETWRTFGKDFWPYGIEANRPTWTAIGQYVHEQGLAPRTVTPEELFAPGFK